MPPPTALRYPPRSDWSGCFRYRKVSGRLETVPYGGVRFPELLRQGRPMDGPYGRTFVGREYFHYGMIATGDHGYLYRCAMPHPADHVPETAPVQPAERQAGIQRSRREQAPALRRARAP